jgi:RNA-binding protein YlmH
MSVYEHFKGDEAFVSKVLDYKSQALDHGRMVLTKFLNPHEQDIVHSVIGNSCQVVGEGGFVDAESKRLIIAPDYYEIVPEDFKIKVYQIDYSERFEHLGHRDVLGALMHLGLNRDCFGDIGSHPLAFALCEENDDYVLLNLKKIKKSHVRLVAHDFSLSLDQQFKKKELVASSLRLDKILGLLYGLSRTRAVEAIQGQYVKVNHKI